MQGCTLEGGPGFSEQGQTLNLETAGAWMALGGVKKSQGTVYTKGGISASAEAEGQCSTVADVSSWEPGRACRRQERQVGV